MKIIAKAPCRITLFCIGQDVEPFCSKYGAKVLNIAINLRHTCILLPRQDDWVWIEAMGESRIHKLDRLPKKGIDPKFDLIYETIRSYAPKTGFQLIDEFDGIQSSGLGSSASACVSMIGAFNKWKGIEMSKLDIAKFAQKQELDLGWISGWQDQIASVFGGVNYVESKGFPKNITLMIYNKLLLENLVKNYLLLFFTGKTRHSDEIQKGLIEGMETKKGIEALKEGNIITDLGIKVLLDWQVDDFGRFIGESWKLKKIANPYATTQRLNLIYAKGLKAGAYGGKILGAGGEGHFLFVCPPEKREKVIKTLEDSGFKQIDFSIDWNGLEVRQI